MGKATLRVGAGLVALIGAAYGCRTTAAFMGEGERLYRAKCSSCHRPVDPNTRSADEWRALLEHHGPTLTDTERATLLAHLAGQ